MCVLIYIFNKIDEKINIEPLFIREIFEKIYMTFKLFRALYVPLRVVLWVNCNEYNSSINGSLLKIEYFIPVHHAKIFSGFEFIAIGVSSHFKNRYVPREPLLHILSQYFARLGGTQNQLDFGLYHMPQYFFYL